MDRLDRPLGFSWSYSRDATFEACHRRYYYRYYGRRGAQAADQRTHDIHRLGSLTNRWMWTGSMVHESIEEILGAHRSGSTFDVDAHVGDTLRSMRKTIEKSARAASGTSDVRFMEHEFSDDIPDAWWDERLAAYERSVRAFVRSEVYAHLRSTDASRWEIEEPAVFDVSGVATWAVLDLLTVEPDGTFQFWDWKTGSSGSEEADEMGVYALYVARKFGAPARQIRASLFFLGDERVLTADYTDTLLQEATRYVETRSTAMRALLRDADNDVAVEEDFVKTTERHECRGCAFRRMCWPDEEW